MDKFLEISELLPIRAYRALCKLQSKKAVEEIRIKANSPLSLLCSGNIFFLTKEGELCKIQNQPIILTQSEIDETFVNLCKKSVYAKESEISKGFVTYKGCRCGIYGTVIPNTNGECPSFSKISGINIRMAKEFKNCAAELVGAVIQNGIVMSTLIVSPPCGGKTTMLRDLACQLSRIGKRVVVIDERGEISGDGSFDLGVNTQVLMGIEKTRAMENSIRTLNPSTIIIDEIGSVEEIEEMLGAINTGVPIIASAHAGSFEELLRRPQFAKLYKAGAIQRVVILDMEELGQIKGIYRLKGAKNEDIGSDFNSPRLLRDRGEHGSFAAAEA